MTVELIKDAKIDKVPYQKPFDRIKKKIEEELKVDKEELRQLTGLGKVIDIYA